jgi:radical SAM superfamily enzyme YgiQ (UPF0313 family)
MLKKISFVNPNFQVGPAELNAHYLPYTSGILWAYILQFEHLRSEYSLGEFVWRRDSVEEVVKRLKDNDIVGFCTYIWNKNYNYTVARELKKANPNILIVGGGPEIAVTDSQLFSKLPQFDLIVKQEGEIAFKEILEAHLTTKNYEHIPGLVINKNETAYDTGPSLRIMDLDKLPSPYLDGVFDHLVEQFPEILWNATIETNRGCPYQCTFCDWGSATYSKIRKFDLQRVFDELEWIGSNKCDFLIVTDANFGIFPERDMQIASKLVEVQHKYDNPKSYTITWAKNQKQDVVNIAKKLIEEGKSKIGLNVSVQSMHAPVLEIVKRKNLGINKIEEIFSLCEKNNIPLFTELILGLPGETLSSWKNNFYELYKTGNHTGITVYRLTMLENAEMNLKQRSEYNIEGSIVYDYIEGNNNEGELREGIEMVVSTKDMSKDEMILAQLWTWYMTTFHINGITNFISRILYKKYGIEYSEFYERLYNFLMNDEWFLSEFERVKHPYSSWTKNGKVKHPPMGDVVISGTNINHSTSINIRVSKKQDHIFNLIDSFLRNNFKLEESLYQDLILLQKEYHIDYNEIHSYPKTLNLNHDVLGYLKGEIDILESPAKYTLDFPENKHMGITQFCELIFFARRRNFAKAWITTEQQ